MYVFFAIFNIYTDRCFRLHMKGPQNAVCTKRHVAAISPAAFKKAREAICRRNSDVFTLPPPHSSRQNKQRGKRAVSATRDLPIQCFFSFFPSERLLRVLVSSPRPDCLAISAAVLHTGLADTSPSSHKNMNT
jgi:hypothetical protein